MESNRIDDKEMDFVTGGAGTVGSGDRDAVRKLLNDAVKLCSDGPLSNIKASISHLLQIATPSYPDSLLALDIKDVIQEIDEYRPDRNTPEELDEIRLLLVTALETLNS